MGIATNYLSFFAFIKYFASMGACIEDQKTCFLFKEETWQSEKTWNILDLKRQELLKMPYARLVAVTKTVNAR